MKLTDLSIFLHVFARRGLRVCVCVCSLRSRMGKCQECVYSSLLFQPLSCCQRPRTHPRRHASRYLHSQPGSHVSVLYLYYYGVSSLISGMVFSCALLKRERAREPVYNSLELMILCDYSGQNARASGETGRRRWRRKRRR